MSCLPIAKQVKYLGVLNH